MKESRNFIGLLFAAVAALSFAGTASAQDHFQFQGAACAAGAPYLHSGASPTLDDEMAGVTHRAAGTSGIRRRSRRRTQFPTPTTRRSGTRR